METLQTPGNKREFDKAYKQHSELNKELYDNYVNKMKTSLRDDPSTFWQYVNSKRNTSNQPKTMRLGDTKTSDETEQANLFAEFFGSNYTNPSVTAEP